MVSSLTMKSKSIVNKVYFFKHTLSSKFLIVISIKIIEVCKARIGHQFLPSDDCDLEFLHKYNNFSAAKH